ncbi:PilN domain-containing protein [Ramlibacter sp. H39-3-26]|uniref:PilN domain-containing protein n=1 Tax=Curvibacter soli TaxID=3031331 RepID=UPI0023DADF60|nr:PilN domain-containing protein [Ramlibacter sp. H39-3-26]MDF1486405.1 PilN domain-containing protein [Ramlibacter sp. H39-3-26]
MPSIDFSTQLFGLDLRRLWRDTCKAWSRLLQRPALDWLAPPITVLLHKPGGTELWQAIGKNLAPARAARLAQVQAWAMEVPDDRVLWRRLTMPSMPAAEVANAVALEADNASPFAREETALGYIVATEAGQRGLRVDLALASRRQIDQYMLVQRKEPGSIMAALPPEAWAIAQDGRPVVLSGFGEALRARLDARGRRIGYGLLAVAVVLVLAIMLTPVIQLRHRAIEAVNRFDDLVARTQPIVQQRSELAQGNEQLADVGTILAVRIDPLRIMERLTQVLPDDTYLQSVSIQGLKITMSGQTANAAALMQLLSSQPDFHDVKAPSAATRPLGAPKETFNIELKLELTQPTAPAQEKTPSRAP